MSIFIANGTRQNKQIFLRLPELTKVLRIDVPSGQQREIGRTFSQEQLEATIKQLEHYGYVRKDSVPIIEHFGGVIYIIGKAATETDILDANKEHLADAQNRSIQEAQRAALGFDLLTHDDRTGKRMASETSVEIIEDVGRNAPESASVNFSMTVTPNGHDNVRI